MIFVFYSLLANFPVGKSYYHRLGKIYNQNNDNFPLRPLTVKHHSYNFFQIWTYLSITLAKIDLEKIGIRKVTLMTEFEKQAYKESKGNNFY